jgi:glycolate oxidase FAD binding subunit
VSPALVDAVAPPADLASLAARVRAAAGRGGALEVRGSRSWWTDVPAGVEVISAAGLDAVSDFNPADLVVTVGAGVPLDRLAARLAARGAWLPFDPPGAASRTVGGALACGGGGPLAAHYGPARDHVLGLVVVAGDGTVVRLGGRVVKNVAGFDVAKLVIGGHGALGVIAEAHLRLRARPQSDRSAVWTGTRAWAARAGAAALAAGATPAAFEVLSPALATQLGLGSGDAWGLAARAVGADAGVAEQLDAIAHAAGSRGVRTTDGDEPWTRWRSAVGRWPVVVRIGAEPSDWDGAIVLAERHLGCLSGASVTVPRGTVRVGAEHCDAETIRRLRAEAAARRWPVTLERADAATRAAVGLWGALSPAVERLTRGLKATFDPAGVLAAPLLA